MGFELKMDPGVFEKITAETKKALTRVIALTSEKCVSETKKNLTWDHGMDRGELRNSYTWTMNSEGEIKVASFEGESVSRVSAPGAAAGEFAVNIGTPLIRGSWLENGTKPHFPPISALIDWVHHKGLTGTYSVKTNRRTGGKANIASEDEQMAFVIARSISRKGTRPVPHLFPGIQAGMASFGKLLRQEVNATRIK
jgi:hypothetical protein